MRRKVSGQLVESAALRLGHGGKEGQQGGMECLRIFDVGNVPDAGKWYEFGMGERSGAIYSV